MSNLDYPISLLKEAGDKISITLNMTGVEQVQMMNQLNGVIRAINILREEKMKDEDEEREKKENLKNIMKIENYKK